MLAYMFLLNFLQTYFVPGIFLMVAMICFTTNYFLPEGAAFGYSFILGWVACGLSIVGAMTVECF